MIAKGLIENGDNVSLIAPISHDAFSALQFPRETHFTSLGKFSRLFNLYMSVLHMGSINIALQNTKLSAQI